jgi:hypothetical protein
MSRVEAGRLPDQIDQAVMDAITRYNCKGHAGLKDRPHSERPISCVLRARTETFLYSEISLLKHLMGVLVEPRGIEPLTSCMPLTGSASD